MKDIYVIFLFLFIVAKIFSFIVSLNVFGLLADFKSDGRLFHIFSPR